MLDVFTLHTTSEKCHSTFSSKLCFPRVGVSMWLNSYINNDISISFQVIFRRKLSTNLILLKEFVYRCDKFKFILIGNMFIINIFFIFIKTGVFFSILWYIVIHFHEIHSLKKIWIFFLFWVRDMVPFVWHILNVCHISILSNCMRWNFVLGFLASSNAKFDVCLSIKESVKYCKYCKDFSCWIYFHLKTKTLYSIHNNIDLNNTIFFVQCNLFINNFNRKELNLFINVYILNWVIK